MKRTGQSTSRRFPTILIAAMTVFLAAGCATAQPDPNSHLGAEVLQNISPFEQRVLADKHVTQTELDESTHVYTECLTAAGLKYEITPGQTGTGSIWVTQTGSPRPDSDDAMQECTDQVNAVENVWILQNPGNASGAQPLPGLKDALDQLDTSGWRT